MFVLSKYQLGETHAWHALFINMFLEGTVLSQTSARTGTPSATHMNAFKACDARTPLCSPTPAETRLHHQNV